MKTVSIISHKGGAGKTSSAVMLAEDLAGRGLRVLLVDADRQRGAGLLLGLEQPSDQVQQTRNIRLKYLCASTVPLRDTGKRAEEINSQFDVAVVDTPSLDDPLAKAWLQLSSHILLVVPVEPLSIRTMESADTALDTIRQTNPQVEVIGILPAMFDEQDATQRQLMMELRSLRADELLSPAIPHDPGLAHRAEQKSERKTEAAQETKAAYSAVGDNIVKRLGLESAARPAAGAATAWSGSTKTASTTPAAATSTAATPKTVPAPTPQTAPAPPPKSGGVPVAAIVIAIVVIIGIVVAVMMMNRPAGSTGINTRPAAAATAV
jgi:chromosome partitioning protein